MSFESRRSLDRNIEVRASNRPIRIAYLIPFHETGLNHWIIDAVFYECYTRWSGCHTLIVPTDGSRFLHEEYESWLEIYDPDFIYSYVHLERELIEKINFLSCPMVFLEHKKHGLNEDERWQDYLPNWGIYFKAVSSLSTIHRFRSGARPFWIKEEAGAPAVITQWNQLDEYRFIPDNFGAALDLYNYPNPIQGLYDTFCFTPHEVPKYMIVGTCRTNSIVEVLQQLSVGKVLPIAWLASIFSESIPRVQSRIWETNFNLFVGRTCLDRIHFWNARNLCGDMFGVLLVTADQLQDNDFVTAVGQYLNKHNLIGMHSGAAHVVIRSYTHNKEELGQIRDRLSKCTSNMIYLDARYNSPAIPMPGDPEKPYISKKGVTTFKLSEDLNEIQAKGPEHFAYIPTRFLGHDDGQWIVELGIERHNNLSQYSNVVDQWLLPRRYYVAKAFTKKLARVSRNHRLSLIPSTDSFPFRTEAINRTFSYDLSLPDDEDVFRWLILSNPYILKEDLRSALNNRSCKKMNLSDKGQNLRGVISMFDHLYDASNLLTNQYWRNVLRTWKGKGDDNKVRARSHFDKCLPDNLASKEILRAQLRFGKIGHVTKYLQSNLTDTLEFLVKKKIFFRIYQWRCAYCGHSNTRTFEDIKEINNCDICSTNHFAPIDLEWKYKLNDFIYRTLCEHNGLPVLWALGHLQEMNRHASFYYLPEVDLYLKDNRSNNKYEIDFLCVMGGRFYAAEVKLSAASFIEKPDEIIKFIEKIKMIQPDTALLVFERYCESEVDIRNIKTKLDEVILEISRKVGRHITVKSLVASDVQEFNEYPVDLGYSGERVQKMVINLERKK
jgi:hypothetical protein